MDKNCGSIIDNEVEGYTLQNWVESISHIRSGPLNKQEAIDKLKELCEVEKKTNEMLTKLQQIVKEQRQGFEGITF